MYLSSNYRTDILFTVNPCVRFTKNLRRSHADSVKRICYYLFTLKPNSDMKLNCYVDAKFSGLWNNKDYQDPMCVKSRTGYVMTIEGCIFTLH